MDGQHFTDDILKRIFVNENVKISTKFLLEFDRRGPIYNIPARRQAITWPMMFISLSTHICVTHSIKFHIRIVMLYQGNRWIIVIFPIIIRTIVYFVILIKLCFGVFCSLYWTIWSGLMVSCCFSIICVDYVTHIKQCGDWFYLRCNWIEVKLCLGKYLEAFDEPLSEPLTDAYKSQELNVQTANNRLNWTVCHHVSSYTDMWYGKPRELTSCVNKGHTHAAPVIISPGLPSSAVHQYNYIQWLVDRLIALWPRQYIGV